MDYKKYSLEKLEEWVHDALSCGEASPQEIYDVIKKVVEENYYTYKDHTSRCYELLALLNGNGKGHLSCNKDDPSPECKKSWNDFWEEHYYPEEHSQYTEEELNAMCDAAEEQDKVVKWQLPVEVDGLTGDCFIQFPDDLLEVANLKEGDQIEWIDRKGGSFELRKVNGTK
jgi:hypothetical protein